jgi:hypothetical protein
VKAWVYVEGESDVLALNALWQPWLSRLRAERHTIEIIALIDKARYFKKIGARAADKLAASPDDVVVGLPDLYPSRPYEGTEFAHTDFVQLQTVQRALVKKALENRGDVGAGNAAGLLERFYASALKHDLEMLLLAAADQLRDVLGTRERLGKWRKPVEDQDQAEPPKHIVEQLFLAKSADRRAYRDTRDAPSVLRRVQDIRSILFTEHGQLTCPVFKDMLDWLGHRLGIPPYSAKPS